MGSTIAPHDERAIRAAATLFGGFALLAVVNACAIAARVPSPGFPLRLSHYVFDAAETLGVGAVFAVAIGAFVRFVPLPRWALSVLAVALATAVVHRVAGDSLGIFSERLMDGRYVRVILVLWTAGIGVVLATAPILATLAARHASLRFFPLPVAVALLVQDQVSTRDDHFDVHGLLALVAVGVGGAALAPWVSGAGRALARSLGGRVVLAALGLFALFGVAYPPPDATRFELFRQPCAVAPWILATVEWRAPPLHAPVGLPDSPWLRDRTSAPAVPPTSPPFLPDDAVVVLITIDAVRADVIADPRNDARFPTLTKLKHDGVFFTHVSTPGTQTEVSMATVFSGRYYSELEWADYGSGWTFNPHPAHDTTVRFPEILSEHGVATANYAGIAFLGAEFGITRGFREEALLRHEDKKTSAPASELLGALTERLRHPGEGPLFLCTHLIDTHAPYGLHKRGDSLFTSYLNAIRSTDSQLGRIVDLLEKSFDRRWVLIVGSDHGEAFGEHQTFEHTRTLYEELLRVPLIVRSPRFAPRTVDDPVGLVDLGPTILDLFGVATPATFNGQSLVPFLEGGTVALTRPLIAEGRLRRAITEPDGLKVIDDTRRKVVEVYDLKVDPGETRNLFDIEPARSDAALAELRAFFAVHTLREPGYEPPYRP